MKRTALVLFLCSCASWPRGFLFMDTKYPVAFTTECGVRVLGPLEGEAPLPESWTPVKVQEVENAALRAFATLEDWRFATACERLNKWQVQVIPQKNFLDDSGELAGGKTDCGMGRIFIGNSPPIIGRLGHELAHAVQGCKAGTDGRVYLDLHYQWEPIYAALKAQGLPE